MKHTHTRFDNSTPLTGQLGRLTLHWKTTRKREKNNKNKNTPSTRRKRMQQRSTTYGTHWRSRRLLLWFAAAGQLLCPVIRRSLSHPIKRHITHDWLNPHWHTHWHNKHTHKCSTVLNCDDFLFNFFWRSLCLGEKSLLLVLKLFTRRRRDKFNTFWVVVGEHRSFPRTALVRSSLFCVAPNRYV